MIESRYHKYNYFVTLTYAPEHLPLDESVDKETVRKYLKRLRYFCGYMPRHFGCAEYGDESSRPHYHICIFADTNIFNEIMKAWDFGRIEVDALTPGRCQYCAGYVLKKMTKADDPRLHGRNPEFWFGSRKPGIGYDFLFEFLERFAFDLSFREQVLTHVYPPSSVRMGGKNVRLPRYIRDKLKPLWRYYNEEKMEQSKADKASFDREILKTLCSSLSELLPIEVKDAKAWRVFTTCSRRDRELREQKARDIKKRRIL